MRCGIDDFARRGLKTPQTQDFWVFILSPGTSTRSATWDLDSQRRGPWLAAQGTLTSSASCYIVHVIGIFSPRQIISLGHQSSFFVHVCGNHLDYLGLIITNSFSINNRSCSQIDQSLGLTLDAAVCPKRCQVSPPRIPFCDHFKPSFWINNKGQSSCMRLFSAQALLGTQILGNVSGEWNNNPFWRKLREPLLR